MTARPCFDNLDNDMDYFEERPPQNDSLLYTILNSTGGIDCRYTGGDTSCNNTYVNVSGTVGLCQLGHETNCNDNFDNDQDYGEWNYGYPNRTGWAGNYYGGVLVNPGADCDDYSCQGNSACPSKESNPDCKRGSCPQSVNWCNDGIDNDLDALAKDGKTLNFSGGGGIDCTSDSSKWDIDCNNTYVADAGKIGLCQLGRETTCNDNFDNDRDGLTDCSDYDCAGSASCPKTEKNDCADGIDNDLDNVTDCADPDCNGKNGPGGTLCEYGSEKTCNDGKDNDGDGLTDCYDSDCNGVGNCATSEYGINWKTTCADGIDNDIDNVTDCFDSDCFQKGGSCFPCPASENVLPDSCADGIDNDGNGAADCADASCNGEIGPNNQTCEYQTETICNDGQDNDADGYADCLGGVLGMDTDCNCTTSERVPGGCNDGINNDAIYRSGGPNCIQWNSFKWYCSACSDYPDYDCGGMAETSCSSGSPVVTGYNSPDPACIYSARCHSKDATYPSENTTALGIFNIAFSDYVHRGENFTITYTNANLNVGSLNIWLGSSGYPISQIVSECPPNTYLTGPNASKFVKQCESTTYVKAQDATSYQGALNVTIAMTANSTLSPGNYTLETEISYPGSPTLNQLLTFYVSENEMPFANITYPLNTSYVAGNITVIVDANDSIGNSYDSGIDYCELRIDANLTWEKASTCRRAYAGLSYGVHTVYARAVDNARNTGDEKNVTFTLIEPPVQSGQLVIGSVPSNYINSTASPVVSVNFTSSKGFFNNTAGCIVRFWNKTGALAGTEYLSLDNSTAGKAVCNGTINSNKPEGHYSISVSANDTLGTVGTSENKSAWMCAYGYRDGRWRCLAECETTQLPAINEVNITGAIYRENNITISANITAGYYALDTVNWPKVFIKKPHETAFSESKLYETNASDIFKWNITVNSTRPAGLWIFSVEARDTESASAANLTNSSVRAKLNLTIVYPAENQPIYKGAFISLNATALDEFGNTPDTRDAIWYITPGGNSSREILSRINGSWYVSEISAGPAIINVTGNSYYDSNVSQVNVSIWGSAKIQMVSPAEGLVTYIGNMLNITCNITDIHDLTMVENYTVNVYDNDVLIGTPLTDANGTASYSYDTSPIQSGIHTIKCNITDNSTLYYNASVASDERAIEIRGPLIINISFTPENRTILRYDTAGTPYELIFNANITDTLHSPVGNANVSVYASFTGSYQLIANCTTLANGLCSTSYNPDDNGALLGNYTIKYNATRSEWSFSNTTFSNIIIMRKLFLGETVVNGPIWHAGNTYVLNASIWNEEGQGYVPPDDSFIKWYLNDSVNYSLIGSGSNITYSVQSNETPKDIIISMNATKDYFIPVFNETGIEIWAYSKIYLNTTLPSYIYRKPPSANSITLIGKVEDVYYPLRSLQTYPVNMRVENSTGYAAFNVTVPANSSNHAADTWTTGATIIPGQYKWVLEITDNHTLNYNASTQPVTYGYFPVYGYAYTNMSVDSATVYRDDEGTETPKEATITVYNMYDEFDQTIAEGTVNIYYGTGSPSTLLTACIINASQPTCTYAWNPDDTLPPGDYTIFGRAVKSYYTAIDNAGSTVRVKGKLFTNMTHPNEDDIMYRHVPEFLNATIFDENNQTVPGATVSWFISTQMDRGVVATGAETTWNVNIVPDPYLGNNTLQVNAQKLYYVDSIGTGRKIRIYAYAKPSVVQPANGSMAYRNTPENMSCRVTDANTSAALSDYIVTLSAYNSTSLVYQYSGYTDSGGYLNHTLNFSGKTPGMHTVNCNTTDEPEIKYYTSAPPANTIYLNVYGLFVPGITVSETTLYRANNSAPNQTVLAVHVLDEYGANATNVNVTFSYNSTSNSTLVPINIPCITDSFGLCNITWNPDDAIVPEKYLVHYKAQSSFYSSNENTTNITVLGKINATIILPAISQVLHRGTNEDLKSRIIDENGQNITANLFWYDERNPSVPVKTSASENTTWLVASDYNLGATTLELFVNKTQYYVNSSANISINVYGWSGVNMTYPALNGTTLYKGLNAFLCRAYDMNNTNPSTNQIPAYPVNFSIYNSTGALMESYVNLTDAGGIASYNWNSTGYLPAWYSVNCTISDNATLNYTALAAKKGYMAELVSELSVDITNDNNTVYRKYDLSYPSASTATKFTVSNVRETNGTKIGNVNVSFYYNTNNYIGSCITDSGGNCTTNVTWNPDDTSAPGIYEIYYDAVKLHYKKISTKYKDIEVRGRLFIGIYPPPASNEPPINKTKNYPVSGWSTYDDGLPLESQYLTWYDNAASIGTGTAQTWVIGSTYVPSNRTIKLEANKPSSYYDSAQATVPVQVWGFATIYLYSSAILDNNGYSGQTYPSTLERGERIQYCCRARDTAYAPYGNVQMSKSYFADNIPLGSTTGCATWQTTNDNPLGSRTIVCNMTNDASLNYYASSPSSSTFYIDLWDNSYVGSVSATYSILYRDGAYGSPSTTTINASGFTDYLGRSISNLNASFYLDSPGSNKIGQCTVQNDSCTLAWDPDDYPTPGSHTIYVEPNKEYYHPHYSSISLSIMGALNTSILEPQENQAIHRGEQVQLKTQMRDEHGNIPAASYTLDWHNASKLGLLLTSTNDNENTTWQVPANYPRGNATLVAWAFGPFWEGSEKTRAVQVLEWSGVNVTNPKNNSKPYHGVINVTCSVYELNTGTRIGDYPVSMFLYNGTGELINSTSGATGQDGNFMFRWDTSYLPIGSYSAKCNITSNESMFYDAGQGEGISYFEVGNWQNITMNISQKTIYRNDSYGGYQAAVYSTLFAINVTQNGQNVNNSNVTAYYNSSASPALATIGSNLTDENGTATLSWNPPDNITPDNYSIYYMSFNGYNHSDLMEDAVIVKGAAILTILNGTGLMLAKNETHTLSANASDENANAIISNQSISWYDNDSYNYIGGGHNLVWAMAANYTPGNRTINATMAKEFYDIGSSAINVTVFGYSNISMISPPGNIRPYRTNMTINCRVVDNYDPDNATKGITGYNVSYYKNYNNTGDIYLGSNTTIAQGYASHTWGAESETIGPYALKCNITDDLQKPYYAISGEQSVSLNLSDVLYASATRNNAQIYRVDDYSPNASVITINVTSSGSMAVENATARVYNLSATPPFGCIRYDVSSCLDATCTTGSSGLCNVTVDPYIYTTPGTYKLKYSAEKEYNYSGINEIDITVRGKFIFANVTSPGTDDAIIYKNETKLFTSVILDDNWLTIGISSYSLTKSEADSATKWNIDGATQYGINVTWSAAAAATPGKKTINLSGIWTYYDSISSLRNFTLWGWSQVSLPATQDYARGIDKNIACSVTDRESSLGISGYPTSFYIYNSTGDLVFSGNKSTSGASATYVWDNTYWEPGIYTLKCNITDNSSLYYKAITKESQRTINLLGQLVLTAQTTMSDIYRDNDTYPNSTMLKGNVVDENGINVLDAYVAFQSGTALSSSCYTDASGNCSVVWNPDDVSVTPAGYSITASATKSYYSGNNKFLSVNVLGLLGATIVYPNNNALLVKGTSPLLDSTIIDENGAAVPSTAIAWEWRNIGEIDPKVIVASTNPDYTWAIPGDFKVGNKTILLEASKTYYRSITDPSTSVSKDERNVTFFGHSGADVNMSSQPYGQGIHNIKCRVTDNENTNESDRGISNYPVYFYDVFGGAATYLGTNNSQSDGYATYAWNATDIYTVLPGSHALLCNVTNQGTLFYNSTRKNKATVSESADASFTIGGANATLKMLLADDDIATINMSNSTDNWVNGSFENNAIPYPAENVTEAILYAAHNESSTENASISVDYWNSPAWAKVCTIAASITKITAPCNITAKITGLDKAMNIYLRYVANLSNGSMQQSSLDMLKLNITYIYPTGNAVQNITIIDTTAPAITIRSPSAGLLTDPDVLINVTTDELADVWYDLDKDGQGNISLYNSTYQGNTTVSGLGGQNTLTVYANDSFGNLGSKSVTFYLGVLALMNRVFYEAGTPVNVTLNAGDAGLNINMNLSSIDSGYNSTHNETIIDNGDGTYQILYNITQTNTRANANRVNFPINLSDGRNASVNMSYRKTWGAIDVDNAVNCYIGSQTLYYFSESECTWDADVSLAYKKATLGAVEKSCENGVSDDYDWSSGGTSDDGLADCLDPDCTGIVYDCPPPKNRADHPVFVMSSLDIYGFSGLVWQFGGSAPFSCTNNICSVSSLWTPATTVDYTEKVAPGGNLTVRIRHNGLSDNIVTFGIKYLSPLNPNDSTAFVSGPDKLSYKEVSPDSMSALSRSCPTCSETYTGNLDMLLTVNIPPSQPEGTYTLQIVRSINGTSPVNQNFTFDVKSVSSGGMVYEHDISCSDSKNNDLNWISGKGQDIDYFKDCNDPDCDTYTGNGAGKKCRYENESKMAATSNDCMDNFDNDADSGQDCRTSGYDLDCNNTIILDASVDPYGANVGGTTGICQLGGETNCTDGFDNDRDRAYDCVVSTVSGYPGPAGYYDTLLPSYSGSGITGEYNCGESCRITAPKETVTTCLDGKDNDLDYYTYSGAQNSSGGMDCRYQISSTQRPDTDCNGLAIGPSGQLCELGKELNCTDGWDNDRDQAYDCVVASASRTKSSSYNGQSFSIKYPKYDNGATAGYGGDGEYDCQSYCTTSAYNENTTSACTDEKDNDLDFYNSTGSFNATGGMDCRYWLGDDESRPDPSCNGIQVQDKNGKTGTCELYTELNCTDGVDNDMDRDYNPGADRTLGAGGADCDDYDCAGKGNCPAIETTNKTDGLVRDFFYFNATPGWTWANNKSDIWCLDRKDNDLDYYSYQNRSGFAVNSTGGIDCIYNDGVRTNYTFTYDTDCNNTAIGPEGQLCQLGTELNCTDTFDNDQDFGVPGMYFAGRGTGADCDDYSCRGNAACPTNESGSCTPSSCGPAQNTCLDGIDNDLDKYQQNGYTPNATGGVDCVYDSTKWDTDCNNTYINVSGTVGLCQLGVELNCTDGIDNDQDKLNLSRKDPKLDGTAADCDDYDCAGKGNCPAIETTCDDGIDNDLDGKFDCNDPDCNDKLGPGGIVCTAPLIGEVGILACGNNYTSAPLPPYSVGQAADDDGDNAANCYDSGCYKKGSICSVCPEKENYSIDSCADGIDNELNIMGIPYYSTSGQYNPYGYTTDNTDCSDSDCAGRPGPSKSLCGKTETSCTNKIDDDLDGEADCSDSDCSANAACTLPSATVDKTCNIPPCDSIGAQAMNTTFFGSGNLKVEFRQYVHRGENLTIRFINQTPVTVSNPYLSLGGDTDSIPAVFNATPSSTNLEGGTSGYTKSVSGDQSKSFAADCTSCNPAQGIDITFAIKIPETNSVITTSDTYTFGIHANFITGMLIDGLITVDVLENEKPSSSVVTPSAGYEINRTSTSDPVTVRVNATDEAGNTFDSNIDKCEVSVDSPGSLANNTNCAFSLSGISDGAHTLYYRAYDQSGNFESYHTSAFTVTTTPAQSGDFYNISAANKLKVYYNSSEMLAFGVNFTSNYAFAPGNCSVWLENGAQSVFLGNATLTPYGAGSKNANCNASLNLSGLSDNEYYGIAVSVKDTNGRDGLSKRTARFFNCKYKTAPNGKTICMDACETNSAPAIENVSIAPAPARRNFNATFGINITDSDPGMLGELNTQEYPKVWFKKIGEPAFTDNYICNKTLDNHTFSCDIFINPSDPVGFWDYRVEAQDMLGSRSTTEGTFEVRLVPLKVGIINNTDYAIYNNETYNPSLPYNTTLTINVTKADDDTLINNSEVFFYYELSGNRILAGTNTTNESGITTYLWNPPDDIAAGDYGLLIEATLAAYDNSSIAAVPVEVWGWSRPEWSQATQLILGAQATLVCKVEQQSTGILVPLYPVEFTYNKTYMNPVHARQNMPQNNTALGLAYTNATGYTSFSWVPDNLGTFNFTCIIGDNSTLRYNASETSHILSVQINDTTNPKINLVNLSRAALDLNYQSINISANVSDNWKVHTVWANITGPSGSVNRTLTNITPGDESGIWYVEYTPALGAGAYNVTVYANDSSGNPASNGTYLFTAYGKADAQTAAYLVNTSLKNITIDNNGTVTFQVNITNNGPASMYDTVLQFTKPSDVYAPQASYGIISAGQSAIKNISLNVTRNADAGNNQIFAVKAYWMNPDNTYDDTDFLSNTFYITIPANTYIRITLPQTKAISNYTVTGENRTVGEVTLQNYGNMPLDSIQYTISGNLSPSWLFFSPPAGHNLSKQATTEKISVMLNIPEGTAYGRYSANVTINTTNSTGGCATSSQCRDSFTLGIDIMQKDWTRDKKTLLKIAEKGTQGSAGTINVTNQKSGQITLTAISNTTLIAPETSVFAISPNSSYMLGINYNATGLDEGDYFATISIYNSTLIPDSLKTDVTLKIVPFGIYIISPNETNRFVGADGNGTVVGENITALVNATLMGAPLGENLTWEGRINDIACTGTYAEYYAPGQYWLVNCTAPYIPLNPINTTIKTIAVYNGYAQNYDEKVGAVEYRDVTPPQFLDISATNVLPGINATVNITATITDNKGVDSVWGFVTYVNDSANSSDAGPRWNITFQKVSGSLWNASVANISEPGDYDVFVYANDSMNNTNLGTGVFEVFNTLVFSGILTDKVDSVETPVGVSFDMYRPGTNTVVHKFSTNGATGSYNRTIAKKIYDAKLGVIVPKTGEYDEVKFYGMNTNVSSSNLSDALRVGQVPLYTQSLPESTKGYGIAGIALSTGFEYTKAEVTINYSLKAIKGTILKKDLYIYRCNLWDFSTQTCNSLPWVQEAYRPDENTNQFAFNVSHFSAYFVAEYCPSCVQVAAPAAQTSGGSSGGGSSSYCGDRSCDPGENFVNCASDCGLNATCGNNICDLFETEENCPSDCAIKGTSPISIKSSLTDIKLFPGEQKKESITITNNRYYGLNATISVVGPIKPLISIAGIFEVPSRTTTTLPVTLFIPENTTSAVYSGNILVSTRGHTQSIPVTITVIDKDLAYIAMKITPLSERFETTENAKFSILLENTAASSKEYGIDLEYSVRNINSALDSYNKTGTVTFKNRYFSIYEINLSEANITEGQYYFVVNAYYNGIKLFSKTETFDVAKTFWTQARITAFTFSIFSIMVLLILAYSYRWQKRQLENKQRYITPADLAKLPQVTGGMRVGQIAETKTNAYMDPNMLTTHVLVAGSTGSGKSVSASVFAEEALKMKIPVVVFDPTAQWTGFVKACKDTNLLGYYRKFGMKAEEAKPFKGLIYDVEKPDIDIDFRKYMNPGEITVFNLNKLKPGEYDQAVLKIVQKIFDSRWEESPQLKLLIVFDEVHRLLEKYGGSGGYIALEKACREFRKWGIGLIMVSQVSADFKEAVQGNILTEIQLNTKSMEDINKIRSKYGEEFAKRVTKQAVGVGIIQNPKYNDGKPWFVSFRPTLHDPHKISEEELNQYNTFARKLEEIEQKIILREKGNADTTDIRLEFRLASDKLKSGHFRMAEIYLNVLEENIKKMG